MRTFLSLLLLGACFATNAAAQNLSGLPGAFADIGFGARPAALGNAYVALADDAYSILWNPAGLAEAEAYELAFSYTDQLGLFDYQYASARGKLPGHGHGFGAALINTGDEAMQEVALYLGYARRYGPLALGLSVKYRQASFGNNDLKAEDYVVFEPDEIADGIANQVRGRASGFGFDLGVRYQFSPRISLGLVLRDLYAPVFWDSQSGTDTRPAKGTYTETIPFEAAIGTAYRISPQFRVTMDYAPAIYRSTINKVRLGAEVTLLDLLALRAGVQQWLDDQPAKKYAVGFGLTPPAFQGLRFGAHYTYVVDRLASSQYMALLLTF